LGFAHAFYLANRKNNQPTTTPNQSNPRLFEAVPVEQKPEKEGVYPAVGKNKTKHGELMFKDGA
jgi:hypothetical protein